jgi:transposase
MGTVYLGIDVGNTFSEVLSVNEECEPTYADRIRTLDERAWAELLGLFEGCEIHAAFEVGTHYGWLYDLLNRYCVEVVVIDTATFAAQTKSHKKTDEIDAAKIATGVWRGDLPAITVPDARIRDDRRLVAHLHAISNSIARAKAHIRTIVFRARLNCPFTNIAGSGAQKWLKEEALSKLEEQEQMLLTQMLEQLELLCRQKAELKKRAAQRVQQYAEVEIAQSIPGFGQLVTLAILSAIIDITRFDTPDQLSAYLGVCGSVEQSGKTLRLGPITRHGSKHVRWLLGQAVTHLTKRDAKARKRYLKLRRKKKPKVARVAMMRWIVTVLWRMLKAKEKYRLNGVKGNHLKRKSMKSQKAA